MRHSKLFNKPMTNRPEYLKKVDEITKARKPKKWCSVHPTGKWEDNFMRCRIGFIRGEDCQEGRNDE